MRLTLTAISYDGEHQLTPRPIVFENRNGIVGRSPDCDWTLADPQHHVSSRHFSVTYTGGGFEITDTSTNGVAINSRDRPLGRGNSLKLSNGDRLFVGDYEIAVALEDDAPPIAFEDESFNLFGGSLPRVEDFPLDHHVDFTEPSADVGIPADPGIGSFSDDYFNPFDEPSADSKPFDSSSFDSPGFDPSGFDLPGLDATPETLSRDTSTSTRGTSIEGSTAPDVTRLLRAFEDGLGISPGKLDPHRLEETLRIAGERLRRLIELTCDLAASRTRLKSELRVDQTQIATSNNNPLKFSQSVEDTVLAMLGTAGRGYQDGDTAIAEIQRDLAAHEMALLRGAKDAIAMMLRRLDPAVLIEAVEGRFPVLPIARKAAGWERFREEFEKLKDDAEDTHGLLAEALAEAYKGNSRGSER